jgi:hypothetical protein
LLFYWRCITPVFGVIIARRILDTFTGKMNQGRLSKRMASKLTEPIATLVSTSLLASNDWMTLGDLLTMTLVASRLSILRGFRLLAALAEAATHATALTQLESVSWLDAMLSLRSFFLPGNEIIKMVVAPVARSACLESLSYDDLIA